MAQLPKTPAAIEARQLTRDNWNELLAWVNGGETLRMDRNAYLGSGEISIVVRTLNGDVRADVGDWIVRGVKGEFVPCKPDVFAAIFPDGPEVPLPGPPAAERN